MTEVGTDVQCVEQGGRRCPDLRENLRGGGSGGIYVRVGDVNDDTTHWEGFGRITPQGCQQGLTDKIQSPSGFNHLWIWKLVF